MREFCDGERAWPQEAYMAAGTGRGLTKLITTPSGMLI